MTVIRIEGDFFGLVKKESDIIPFLVNNKHIQGKTLLGLYDEEKDEYYEKSLIELFGSDWENVLSNKTFSELKEIFEDYFELTIETVWTY